MKEEGFRYWDVFLKGRPQHDKYDPFLAKHPPMPASRWAKIYAPFDALRGFKEMTEAKEILYEEKRILGEDEQKNLNRMIRILKEQILYSRATRQPPIVTVTYYKPCTDVNSEAYSCRGTYETITGICRKVDTDIMDVIQVNQKSIHIKDLYRIEIAGYGG